MPEIPGHKEIREKVKRMGGLLGTATLEAYPAFEDSRPAPGKPSYLDTHFINLEGKIREIIELNKTPHNYPGLVDSFHELGTMLEDFKERVASSWLHNLGVENLSSLSADISKPVSSSMKKIGDVFKEIDYAIDMKIGKAVKEGKTDKRKSPPLVKEWEEVKKFIENLDATEVRKRLILTELIHKNLLEAMEKSFRHIPLRYVLKKMGIEERKKFRDARKVIENLIPMEPRFQVIIDLGNN
jgi:hypothetical protein